MKRKQSPAQLANLIPITKKTARELGRRGALVSNAKQAAAKTFREELKALLEMEIANSKGEKLSTRKAISTALIKEAISGNYRAFAEIRDTIGEKPIEQQEVSIKEPRRFVFEIKK